MLLNLISIKNNPFYCIVHLELALDLTYEKTIILKSIQYEGFFKPLF